MSCSVRVESCRRLELDLPEVDPSVVGTTGLAGLVSLLWTGMFAWSKPANGRGRARLATVRYEVVTAE